MLNDKSQQTGGVNPSLSELFELPKLAKQIKQFKQFS